MRTPREGSQCPGRSELRSYTGAHELLADPRSLERGDPARYTAPCLDALADTGFVALRDLPYEIPESEFVDLEYMDWRSGGDTNFSPLASADGELDCRGFWDKGKTDKDALWTSNAEIAPTIRNYVDDVGANFGRVRIIKLEPQDRETAMRSFHRDDNNRFNPDDEGWVVRSWIELTDNPDSYMLLMDNGPDGLPDPSTEMRVPLHQWRPLRGRHPAPLARRRAQRQRPSLRADHQLRVEPARSTRGSPTQQRSPPPSDDHTPARPGR